MLQAGLKKPYCKGGPGFVLSRPTLKVLTKAIDSCQQTIQATVVGQTRVYDDALIGICIYRETGIGCWDASDYNKDQFYQIFSKEPNDDEVLHAVTSHAFKDTKQMLSMNRRYLSLLSNQTEKLENSDMNENYNKQDQKDTENKQKRQHDHYMSSIQKNTTQLSKSETENYKNSYSLSNIESNETFSIYNRVQAYVTTLARTLDKHKDRLETFRENWKEIPLQYEVNDAILLTKDSEEGLGCSKSLLNAIEKAMNDGTKEFYLFMEDDAAPFASISSNKFSQQLTETIYEWPHNSPYLLLGAYYICHLEDPNKRRNNLGGVTRIQVGMGSYAIMMRRSFLKKFHRQLSRHINQKDIVYAPDAFLFRDNYFDDSRPAFIATPLLVDHSPGYSSTMGIMRKDSHMGKPRWWEIKLDKRTCSRGTYQIPGCDVACNRSSLY